MENYIPQKDTYSELAADGTTISPQVSAFPALGTGNTAEIQTLELSGDATGAVNFLGTFDISEGRSFKDRNPKAAIKRSTAAAVNIYM